LEPSSRVTASIGSVVTALEVLAAEKLRHWAFQYVTDLFEKESLSAIITPSIGIDVPIFEEASRDYGESDTSLSVLLMKHISIVNFLGLPGYTIPVGYTSPSTFHPKEDSSSLKLPLGIQLIGNHWNEHKVGFIRWSQYFGIFFFLDFTNRAFN
jgi:Asp-tRNA(Asn)/Glu-tRNA(Gln) amidotransferase A subunit family amidase